MSLLLSGRDKVALGEVAGRTGGVALPCDLAVPGGAEDLGSRALAAGPVDVLVSCAGVGRAGPFTSLDADSIDSLIAVNLTAPIRLARALVPSMLARRSGHLIFITSIAGEVGVSGEAVYSASKAGLSRFAESLRYEVAPFGVRVSVIVLGVIDTPFFDRRGRPYTRRLPRPIPPKRVAAAVARTIRTGRTETVIPPWLTIAIRLRGMAPSLFRVLAKGQSS